MTKIICNNQRNIKPSSLPCLIILTITLLIVGCKQTESNKSTETEKQEGIELLQNVDSIANLTNRIIAANNVLNFNQNTGNDSLISESFFKLGVLHSMKGNNDSSIFYLEKSRNRFIKLDYKNRELAANGVLIRVYRFLDERESVLELILSSDRIIANEKEPNEEHIFYYLQKAGFYYTIGLQDSTLAAANHADQLAESINSKTFRPQIKGIKGVVYAYLGNDTLAIQNYKSNVDEYEPYEQDKAIILTNLGNAYARIGNLDSSLFYFNLAQKIYLKTDVSEDVINKFRMDISYSLSDLNPALSKSYCDSVDFHLLNPKNKYYFYYVQASYKTSIKEKISATNTALDFLKSLELDQKNLEATCHHDLYNYHSELNDFKSALLHYEQYNTLNNEIKLEAITFKQQALDLIHNVKEKDLKILNQELVINKKDERIESQKHKLWLSISTGLLLLITSFIFVQNYRKKGKINALKLKQNELQQQLLIKEIDPISFQLDGAIKTIEIAKQKLAKLRLEKNQNEVNEIKIILNQWLANFNEKNATKNAQKLIEDSFLDKLNQFPDLTQSEKNVIILIKHGYKTKEISDRLNLAQNTVEIYRSRIRKKLNTSQKETLTDKINNL